MEWLVALKESHPLYKNVKIPVTDEEIEEAKRSLAQQRKMILERAVCETDPTVMRLDAYTTDVAQA